ncbi:MAG: GAF domain-containing protein [Gemmatimonadaceae bacterium]
MTTPNLAFRPLATSSADADTIHDLRRRVDDLTRERDQLLIVVDLLQELSAAGNVADVLQRMARRLGEIFGLDRSSVYLAGEGHHEVRLVATFEDPSLRNLVVDLTRYPELERAFASGQTVLIPDAMNEPMLAAVRHTLEARRVSSIVVVPIQWRQTVIGAIFLRSDRGSVPFGERDIRFCEVIAGLAGRALRNAHQAESRERPSDEKEARLRRADRERIAFVAFMRRMLGRYANSEDQLWAETLLPRESDEELDRLVSVAMRVLAEEAKG